MSEDEGFKKHDRKTIEKKAAFQYISGNILKQLELIIL